MLNGTNLIINFRGLVQEIYNFLVTFQISTLAGNSLAIVQNPTCDETCPENCRTPWKKFEYQSISDFDSEKFNRSEMDLFGLPVPQPISDNWTVDESFKISGGMIQIVN